ncbi:MAG: queuosine precursor transporter [Bacteroidetes bacterium]|nr:queuosine precursor transporter [Bacteroidota bacterium]
MQNKANILFVILGGFFVANVILAELIGAKIFSLEASLGLAPLMMRVFGQEIAGFNLTAGVIMWPVVFIMTDIINEYYGQRGVRLLSFLSAALVLYAFGVVYLAIGLEPAGFWLINPETGLNRDAAFSEILGQGLWIIAGSLVAFLVGQFVDVWVFHWLRRFTGSRKIWLRATGSTLVSQLVDSFVVLFIAFYLSGRFSFQLVLAIAIVNYIYKFVLAVLLTPVLYLVHVGIDRYLGKELAHELTERAAGSGH